MDTLSTNLRILLSKKKKIINCGEYTKEFPTKYVYTYLKYTEND